VNLSHRREIRVWQFDVQQSKQEFPALRELLSPEEQQRALKFHFEIDRERFVVGRGNLRRLLGEQLRCEPGDILFRTGDLGKPELRCGPRPEVFFNVSHSGDAVLIAVAERPVGVDVEQPRRGLNARELAQRFYCAEEWEELRRLEGNDQDQAFFRCWTRKEAIVKALGRGLQVPLSSFYAGTDAAELRIVQTGDGRSWKVRSWMPRAGYAAAVAAAAGDWQLELVPFVSASRRSGG
jgi:4'-phosphopantetheinyl transferase